MSMAFYLSFKEVWRNRGRFFLFSLVIALITTLVLFVAALSEGLGLANKQYLEKLDAQILVYQKNTELNIAVSQIGRSKINNISRVEGVELAGGIGTSSGTIVNSGNGRQQDISLLGVEAGKPGYPPLLEGRGIRASRASEAVIDARIANQVGLGISDMMTIKTIQGTKEYFYNLQIVGITSEQAYQFNPSVFVPFLTWDEIRPQPPFTGPKTSEVISNVVAVKLKNPTDWKTVAERIEQEVSDTQATDIKTAYESVPGYSAQQSTLNTQRIFVLLIGILVVGGFFQIQMLQKIPQIGVLKAIGASNFTVAAAAILQIIMVSTFGVLFGSMVTGLLSIALPSSVPIVFQGSSVALAVGTLLLIGPLGGLVTIRLAVSVEPLTALGLSA
jgi:putative ABC transport system permease protein